MRDDYDHLQTIWDTIFDGKELSVKERAAAMAHYEVAYEHAMLITTRLCDAMAELFQHSDSVRRGNKWIGEVITAWMHQDPHSLENEQMDAYRALMRAEAESEWMRPS